MWRHDNQHNDTQHKELYVTLRISGILRNNDLPLWWLSRFIYDYA